MDFSHLHADKDGNHKVGIAVDPYKLESFKKRLKKEGYQFKVHGMQNLAIIKVKVHRDKIQALAKLIELMNAEAQSKKEVKH